MNDMGKEPLHEYYDTAESWSDDTMARIDRSRRIAWIVAAGLGILALLLVIAIVIMLPLRRDVPYTLLVDRQTGYVETLYPLGEDRITADAALTRSFLAQYVVARESYSRQTLQANFRKVGLWSAGTARSAYVDRMRQTGAAGAGALAQGASVEVDLLSISIIEPNRAMVRFATVESDRGGQVQLVQNWASVIDFHYVEAPMSAEDRLDNPLGFQVTAYNRSPETIARDVVLAPPVPEGVGE